MTAALTVLALVLVYALTLASFHPLDLALGALLAAGVLAVGRRTLQPASVPPAGVLLRRVARFPLFAAAIVREITVGTWQVSLTVLGVRPLSEPGIVAVPIGERTRTGVVAAVLAVTLSPGEVVVDVDWDRHVLLLHLLDASDPDAVRERHERFYQRYQRGVFP